VVTQPVVTTTERAKPDITIVKPHPGSHGTRAVKKIELATMKPVGRSRDVVAANMSAVKREYDAYKAKNGGRLDGDWGDLAMYVQYHQNDSSLDELAKRIDSFRAKMRE
jgi:hypothetical protein